MNREVSREIVEIGTHAGLEALSTIVRVCGTLPTVEHKSIASMVALAFLQTVINDSQTALGPQMKAEIDSLAAIFAKAGMGELLKQKAEKGDFNS